MNRQELWTETKFYAATAKDWIKAHPLISGAVAFVILGFALGLYVRAATVSCAGEVPGTLTCVATAPGPGPSPTPTPTPTPVPTPSPYASCPAGTSVVTGQWGNTAIVTPDFGTQIVVIEVKVPANFSGTKTSSWSEFQSGPITREATLSTKPCDFSNASALKNGLGQAAHKIDVISFKFDYRNGTATGFTYGVTPGTTYYINIRNRDGAGNVTCPAGINCNMRGGLPQ